MAESCSEDSSNEKSYTSTANLNVKSALDNHFEIRTALVCNNQTRQVAQVKQSLKMRKERGKSIFVKVGDLVNVRIPIVDKAPWKTLDILAVVFGSTPSINLWVTLCTINIQFMASSIF